MGIDKHERAAGPKKLKDKPSFSMTWVQFTEKDIHAEYFTQTSTLDEPLERMFESAESGWKYSISYSESYNGYVASATCRDKDSIYENRVFLISHVDGSKAIKAIAYIIHTMLPRGDFLNGNALQASNW